VSTPELRIIDRNARFLLTRLAFSLRGRRPDRPVTPALAALPGCAALPRCADVRGQAVKPPGDTGRIGARRLHGVTDSREPALHLHSPTLRKRGVAQPALRRQQPLAKDVADISALKMRRPQAVARAVSLPRLLVFADTQPSSPPGNPVGTQPGPVLPPGRQVCLPGLISD